MPDMTEGFLVVIFAEGARSAFRQEGPPLQQVSLRQGGHLPAPPGEIGPVLGRRLPAPVSAGAGGSALQAHLELSHRSSPALLPLPCVFQDMEA